MRAASRPLPLLQTPPPAGATGVAGGDAEAHGRADAASSLAAVTPLADAELSEEQLLERHRWGDETAFAEVFRRFAGMVYNLAWRMAGDHEEAHDLSQEVFLRVFRHLGGFGGRSSLKTWIYRVTVNHCRSRLGRRRLPIHPEGAELAARTADPAPSPQQVALSHVAAEEVQGALLGLPRKLREAVLLRDVEGLSYEEIASVLQVPVGTVRSRIARGRAELRAVLEGQR